MDVSETMLQAVDILIKKRIESVRFDETIDATIIDASKSESGQYLVSTGSAKFWAYSQETKYRQNEKVLVTIPQGNYDNQKIIIGKKADNVDGSLPYRSAFSQIIDLTNNLIIGDQGEKGIWANKDDEYQWDVANKEFIPDNISYIWKLSATSAPLQGYTRLGIRAQFSTYLGQYNVITGNYGLALRLIFGYADGQAGSFDKFVYFDSASFYGNPYNYLTYYTLEDVFDISEYKDYPINGIELYIYQRGNFKEVNGTNVPVLGMQNIWMKDPYVCLGTGTEEFLQDTATIYTSNSMTYKGLTTNNIADENFDSSGINNTKIIQLRWVHKDLETEVIKTLSVDDEIDTNEYEIRWYKYRAGAQGDGYAGAHWEQIVSNINQLQISFTPDVTLSQEQVKVLILRNGSLLVASNILTFKNDNEVANRATLIDANALAIRYDNDEFYGHYYLYNAAGEIINQKFVTQIRTLQAVFGQQANVYDKPKLISENFSNITWIIPKTNTMINLISNDNVSISEDGNSYIIENTDHIDFSIKKTFIPGNQNNTIWLNATSIQGEEYPPAQTTLLFGPKGDNGSDYSIRLDWSHNGKNVLDVTSQHEDEISCSVSLLGQNREIINWPSGTQLEVNWYVTTKQGAVYTNTLKKESAETGTYYPIRSKINLITFNGNNANKVNQAIQKDDHDNIIDAWYTVENEGSHNYNYVYDNNHQVWSFNENNEGKYRPITNEDNKKKLIFKPIEKFENIDPITKTIITVINPNTDINWNSNEDAVIQIYNDKKYYYYHNNTYFVMLDNQYVIDPFGSYVDGVTYYEPYEVAGRVGHQLENGVPKIDVDGQTFTIYNYEEGNNNEHNYNIDINSILILEICIKNFGDYDLIRYVPIALKNGTEYNGQAAFFIIDGVDVPDKVNYNSDGTIDFNRNAFTITASDLRGSGITYYHGYGNNNLAGYWQLIYPTIEENNDNFKPSLIETRPTAQQPNDGHYDLPVLNPVGVYIPEAVPYAVQFIATARYQLIGTEGEYNNIQEVYNVNYNLIWPTQPASEKPVWQENIYYKKILWNEPIALWTQPIVCFQNKYQSDTLNAWNGKEILTDNDSGTIVASGFAAGRKEADNTFSGVMLGDWSRTHQEHAVIAKSTGIYGFNHGAMSYAFKDDGTGFIGKDGKGRIYFDGNSSTIYSSNWLGNIQQGMLLDIDDGYLKMQSYTNQVNYSRVSGNIEIPYFRRTEQTREYKGAAVVVKSESKNALTINKDYIQEKWGRYYLNDKSFIFNIDSNTWESIYSWYNDYDAAGYILVDDYVQGINDCIKLIDNPNGFYFQLDPTSVNQVTYVGLPSIYKFVNNNYVLVSRQEIITKGDSGGSGLYIQDTQESSGFRELAWNESWLNSAFRPARKYVYQGAPPDLAHKIQGSLLYQSNNDWIELLPGVTSINLPVKYRVFDSQNQIFVETNITSNNEGDLESFFITRDHIIFGYSRDLYEDEIMIKRNNQLESIGNGELYDYTAEYWHLEPSTRYITLGANQPNYPLAIGTTQSVDGRRFKVDWNGVLHARDGEFEGMINSSNINGSTIYGSTIYGSTIQAGWNTKLDNDGISTEQVNITQDSQVLGTMGYILGQTVAPGDILQSTDNLGIFSDTHSIVLAAIKPKVEGDTAATNRTIRIEATGQIHINAPQVYVNGVLIS